MRAVALCMLPTLYTPHCHIARPARRKGMEERRVVLPQGDDVLGDVIRLGLRWTPGYSWTIPRAGRDAEYEAAAIA